MRAVAARHAASDSLVGRFDPLAEVEAATPVHRALVIGVCLGLAATVTGASLTVGAGRPAAAATPPSSTKVATHKVTAQGSGPQVSASVTGVKAPYALPVSGDAAGKRTDLITTAQANAGTTWKTDAVIPGHCATTTKPGGQGLTAPAHQVMDCIAATFGEVTTYYGVGERSSNSLSDHPSGRAVDAMIDNYTTPEGKKLGWDIAHYVQANAQALNVKYIIWDAQIWTGTTWRPYHHPSGATDDNSLHKNHVHVSVR